MAYIQSNHMRLLIVTTYNDRSEVALYKGLADAGICVEVICSPEAAEVDSLRAHGIPVEEMLTRHRLDLRAAAILRRRLRSEKYEVVYATRNNTLSVTLMASIGCRAAIIGYRGTAGHISRLDPACWLTYLNPRVSRLVCVSEAVRQYLLQFNLPPERLVTIHKGHDPKWYRHDKYPDLSALGISEKEIVVCFTGNIRPVKGVDVLLKAMRLLPSEPPIKLLLVGENRDVRVRRMLSDPALASKCNWLGYRPDAAAIAGASHIFVMPSLAREGLPRAVIEAMAQGVPPVVTSVGGMPELVENNVSGIVVPPGNPQALASGIALLASDHELRQRLGRAAAERIKGKFHIRHTIAKMVALVQEAAEELTCPHS